MSSRSTGSPDTADEHYSRRRISRAGTSSDSRRHRVIECDLSLDRLREKGLIRGPTHSHINSERRAGSKREEQRHRLKSRIRPRVDLSSSPETDKEEHWLLSGRSEGKTVVERGRIAKAVMERFKS